jgi:hypothetical protein
LTLFLPALRTFLLFKTQIIVLIKLESVKEMITQKISYLNLPNCLQISNDKIELVVTTDVGPRILRYALLANGENILGEHPQAAVLTALGEWKPYGGHRLWMAPENMPKSYAPDNAPVEYFVDEVNNSVRLVQPFEPVTKTQKEIVVTLAETESTVEIQHKIKNCGDAEIILSAWALTIMRSEGVCVVPNEPFAPYSGETLLPVRNLTLWSYTDLTDERWSFEKDAIRLRVDENKVKQQKIGVLNKQGWASYEWHNLRFTKRFETNEAAVYPDYNSNVELYTAGNFVELETLSPLTKLSPSESVIHIERWELTLTSDRSADF